VYNLGLQQIFCSLFQILLLRNDHFIRDYRPPITKKISKDTQGSIAIFRGLSEEFVKNCVLQCHVLEPWIKKKNSRIRKNVSWLMTFVFHISHRRKIKIILFTKQIKFPKSPLYQSNQYIENKIGNQFEVNCIQIYTLLEKKCKAVCFRWQYFGPISYFHGQILHWKNKILE
jgi:hypothetical protein